MAQFQDRRGRREEVALECAFPDGRGAVEWFEITESRSFLLQDAQKVRPARPQRAKRRGVRFGTLSL